MAGRQAHSRPHGAAAEGAVVGWVGNHSGTEGHYWHAHAPTPFHAHAPPHAGSHGPVHVLAPADVLAATLGLAAAHILTVCVWV